MLIDVSSQHDVCKENIKRLAVVGLAAGSIDVAAAANWFKLEVFVATRGPKLPTITP